MFSVLLIVGFAWLLVLSFFLIQVLYYFRRLSKDIGKGNLTSLLGRILDNEKKNSKNIDKINSQLLVLSDEGRLHIQKVGLVRFNPFKELGGEHSFSLALLDGTDTGVIITGLHARDRTRMYIKSVSKGQSELELSDEEKRALKIAKK